MRASRYGASRWARPPSGSGQPPTFGSAASPDIPRDSSVGIRQRSLGGGQLVHLGWVVHASVASLGVNPSLTISAVCERAAATLVARGADYGLPRPPKGFRFSTPEEHVGPRRLT